MVDRYDGVAAVLADRSLIASAAGAHLDAGEGDACHAALIGDAQADGGGFAVLAVADCRLADGRRGAVDAADGDGGLGGLAQLIGRGDGVGAVGAGGQQVAAVPLWGNGAALAAGHRGDGRAAVRVSGDGCSRGACAYLRLSRADCRRDVADDLLHIGIGGGLVAVLVNRGEGVAAVGGGGEGIAAALPGQGAAAGGEFDIRRAAVRVGDGDRDGDLGHRCVELLLAELDDRRLVGLFLDAGYLQGHAGREVIRCGDFNGVAAVGGGGKLVLVFSGPGDPRAALLRLDGRNAAAVRVDGDGGGCSLAVGAADRVARNGDGRGLLLLGYRYLLGGGVAGRVGGGDGIVSRRDSGHAVAAVCICSNCCSLKQNVHCIRIRHFKGNPCSAFFLCLLDRIDYRLLVVDSCNRNAFFLGIEHHIVLADGRGHLIGAVLADLDAVVGRVAGLGGRGVQLCAALLLNGDV